MSLERQTYTVPEVAQILGVGRNTAYESCRAGEIPTVRVGSRVLVPRAAIEAMLSVESDEHAA
jgi:excisionase family DNA binding protein